MKSFCRILICCLLTLSAGCVFLDTDMISYGQKADGFDEGVVAFNTSDYQAALRMLQAPAENGNVDAQYLLGLIYINGLADGRRNSYMAEKWFGMAAQAGHTAAQVQLAFLYQDSSAPVYNPLAAYRWFDILIAERPQYREMLDSLHWSLLNQGKLTEAEEIDIIPPKYVYYRGLDYNDLFPPR